MTQGKVMRRNEYTLDKDYLYVFAPDEEKGPSFGKEARAGRKGLAAFCCEKCGFVEFYGVSPAP
jgi:hypothetical protein